MLKVKIMLLALAIATFKKFSKYGKLFAELCNTEMLHKSKGRKKAIRNKYSTLQTFSAGLQAPYRDFCVQGYQNCRGYV